MRSTSPGANSGPPSRKTSRKMRIVLAIVLIPLVTAAGLELGARIINRAKGHPWNAEARRGDIETTCQSVSRRAFVPGGLQDEERKRFLHLKEQSIKSVMLIKGNKL